MRIPKTNRGFIGFITLMIGVLIVAYLMMMQYKKIGVIEQNTAATGSRDSSAVGFVSEQGIDADMESTRSPIDQANDIKDLLESQSRGAAMQ